MKTSIAMATYNGEKYLLEQLESFRNQTILPDELVICDDGSSDNTINIIKEFSKEAPFPIKIFNNKKNLGYVKNFEKAIDLCSGEILFLSDQDDFWFPEKIAVTLEIFKKSNKLQLIQTDMELTNESLTPSGVTQIENILSLGGKISSHQPGCGIALRKEFATTVLPVPDDELFGHDSWLYRISSLLESLHLEERPLSYYRRHGNNVSQSLASTNKPLSMIDSFRAHGLSDAKTGWQKELTRLKLLEQHLKKREAALRTSFGVKTYERAITKIATEHQNLTNRL